ncbi:MAG: cytochrome P450, partial [Gammaproteobacteria bacterium]|nr:cytochrome P450 [Gammaproteobacteria bacterium]
MNKTTNASDPWSIPLDKIDVSEASRFGNDTQGAFFQRLRKEDPVHYCADSINGPYWSVTKFHDIKAVDTNHEVYSSEPSIAIADADA